MGSCFVKPVHFLPIPAMPMPIPHHTNDWTWKHPHAYVHWTQTTFDRCVFMDQWTECTKCNWLYLPLSVSIQIIFLQLLSFVYQMMQGSHFLYCTYALVIPDVRSKHCTKITIKVKRFIIQIESILNHFQNFLFTIQQIFYSFHFYPSFSGIRLIYKCNHWIMQPGSSLFRFPVSFRHPPSYIQFAYPQRPYSIGFSYAHPIWKCQWTERGHRIGSAVAAAQSIT